MASHKLLEHLGEARLCLHAGPLEEVLTEAAIALGRVERGGTRLKRNSSNVIFPLLPQRPALRSFTDLNEVVYLAESEACVPLAAEVRLAGRPRLRRVAPLKRLVV